MINFKVRFKNPVFIAQLAMAVLLPILAYMGITVQDLTTWPALWSVIVRAVSNPYVLGLVAVSVWQTVNDPTTEGMKDSAQALSYRVPKK